MPSKGEKEPKKPNGKAKRKWVHAKAFIENRIKELRNLDGKKTLKSGDISARAGISDEALRDILYDGAMPRLDTLIGLTYSLDVSFLELTRPFVQDLFEGDMKISQDVKDDFFKREQNLPFYEALFSGKIQDVSKTMPEYYVRMLTQDIRVLAFLGFYNEAMHQSLEQTIDEISSLENRLKSMKGELRYHLVGLKRVIGEKLKEHDQKDLINAWDTVENIMGNLLDQVEARQNNQTHTKQI